LEPATEPLTLAVTSAVDLRHRLIPPVAPDAQLCCIGPVPVFVTAPHPADPLTLGRQITTRVRTAIDHGDPQKWILGMNHPDAVLMPSPSVFVSNLGLLATPPTPSGIQITASRFLATYSGPIPLIFVSTTSGLLTLDLVYNRSFLTDQQMTDLADGIESTLGSSTRGSGVKGRNEITKARESPSMLVTSSKAAPKSNLFNYGGMFIPCRWRE
jgi:hypothetical protein